MPPPIPSDVAARLHFTRPAPGSPAHPHAAGMASVTYRTRPESLPPALVAKARPREMSVTGPLTYPGRDLAGDIVSPDGLDFTSHRREPWVDFEHDGRTVAGWCRKSLSRPGKPYDVVRSTVDVPGCGPTTLPFATVSFDPSDRVQSQTFSMFEDGALTGFSLEFRPVPGFCKSLGYRSPLEARDAMRFDRADVVRFTVCATPVCEGAVVLEDGVVRKSARLPVPPALEKVLRDGAIRGERLADPIRKALAAHARPTTRTVARVEKAMDDESVYDDAATADTAAPAAEDAGQDAPATGGIAALYAKAQALLDACDQNEQDMETSDSPELRAKAARWRDKISSLAEEIKATADAHDAKLNGGKSDADTDDDSEPEVESEPDMSTDDEGLLKAIRPAYRVVLKAVRPKRFTLKEVQKGSADPDKVARLTKATKDLARLVKQLT